MRASPKKGAGDDTADAKGQLTTNATPFAGPTVDGRAEESVGGTADVTKLIEELQLRLDEASRQIAQISDVPAAETEIGRLFLEAQRFTETSLLRLETQIEEILKEASTRATQIVLEAIEEADEIRRKARSSVLLPSESAQELQRAVVRLSRISDQLGNGLRSLEANSGAEGDSDDSLGASLTWKGDDT